MCDDIARGKCEVAAAAVAGQRFASFVLYFVHVKCRGWHSTAKLVVLDLEKDEPISRRCLQSTEPSTCGSPSFSSATGGSHSIPVNNLMLESHLGV